MARFGLIGGSYISQSINADGEYSQNWYPEAIESQNGKSAMALYCTPGLSLFVNLPGTRKVWLILYLTIGSTKRCFAIAEDLTNQYLFEVFANKTQIRRGTLGQAGSRPSMTANNGNQVLIASAGRLFVLSLLTNIIQEIDTTTQAALQGPVAQVDYTDGFGIALLANSQEFQISAIDDFTSWDPIDIAQISVFPDNVLAMIVTHREPWMFGPKASIPYYDSGNPNFPFDVIPGAFIEQGIASLSPPVKLDNTIFWVGADERGNGIAWRAVGYTPTRVSTHAEEFAWQGYSTISDVISYSYQDQGHSFWVLYFPTANKTWVYDVATGLWHNRTNFDGSAHLAQCHEDAFGIHLVGDRASGNIYQMSIANLTDNGNLIQRVRRSPVISSENEWLFHNKLELDLEVGLGPQPPLTDASGNPRAPQIYMRYSDDSGHTWSDIMARDCGQAGEFRTRVIWWRLGRSRNRVYEFSCSDPIPWRIIEGYVDASPGFGATERLAKQVAKTN